MVLVEVIRKAYLASIVPVIVNSVLDSHQVIVDIVAFVSKGDFPRSRLGEKQRGKILGAWVTRKMRTIAQFSIRDDDGSDSQITEVAEPRSAVGSVVGVASSLRNVETVITPPAVETTENKDYISLPTGISEMPATYESSIIASPTLPSTEDDREQTPTDPRRHHHNEFPTSELQTDPDHSADYEDTQNDPYHQDRSELAPGSQQQTLRLANPSDSYPDYAAYTSSSGLRYDAEDHKNSNTNSLANRSTFDFSHDPDRPPPAARYDNKPVLSLTNQNPLQEEQVTNPTNRDSALASLPSQQRFSSANYDSHYDNNNNSGANSVKAGSGGGGLRIANHTTTTTTTTTNSNHGIDDKEISEADSWRQEALLSMNLAQSGESGGKNRPSKGQRTGSGGLSSGMGGGDEGYGGVGYGHAI